MPVDETPDKCDDLFGCVHASSDTPPRFKKNLHQRSRAEAVMQEACNARASSEQ